MKRGSVVLYTGSEYHGGGANLTDETRIGVQCSYAVGWLRQEENQYLSVPLDVARDLPVELLRLMGYEKGSFTLGYMDNMRDPMHAVRQGEAESISGLGYRCSRLWVEPSGAMRRVRRAGTKREAAKRCKGERVGAGLIRPIRSRRRVT